MNCALEYDEKGVGRVFVFIDDVSFLAMLIGYFGADVKHEVMIVG